MGQVMTETQYHCGHVLIDGCDDFGTFILQPNWAHYVISFCNLQPDLAIDEATLHMGDSSDRGQLRA
jgi:hypothetical protein